MISNFHKFVSNLFYIQFIRVVDVIISYIMNLSKSDAQMYIHSLPFVNLFSSQNNLKEFQKIVV